MSKPETEYHSQQAAPRQALANSAPKRAVSTCPFASGPLSVDLLLAEVGMSDASILDACLDLRAAMSARNDALELVDRLYRVRALLQGRAYLAFYRVRCWVASRVTVEIRGARQDAWRTTRFPLNAGNLNEALNTCLGQLEDGECPGGLRWNGQVRFRFCEVV